MHPHHPNHPCASTRPFTDRRQDECRPLIVVSLRPEPHVDPMLALRAALKMLLRQYNVRCVKVAIESPAEREHR